jgi:acetylornithine deacetylase/succinyl-diaminopimelate desuccinylase-like protein
VIRGHDLYGRGACDDKGQLWTHVKAVESWLRATGHLPVNIICIFEGEEESGSPALLRFLDRHGPKLRADVAIISDMRMRTRDLPAVTYGLRGALSLELEVRGPPAELHSGLFGGAVHNPIQVLCDIVSRLHHRQGRVSIPGFYDAVRELPAWERADLARAGPADKEVLRDAGTSRGWGEPGYTLFERTTIRPALTITGIAGGYTRAGTKSVIPAQARARFNFRLVPDQDPAHILRLFRRHLAQLVPATARFVIRDCFAASPALMDRQHPALRAAAMALHQSFGRKPVLLRTGGTIPVVNALLASLHVPVLLVGFARPEDHIHAPDERFHLPNFFRGVRTSIRLLAALGHTLCTPVDLTLSRKPVP